MIILWITRMHIWGILGCFCVTFYKWCPWNFHVGNKYYIYIYNIYFQHESSRGIIYKMFYILYGLLYAILAKVLGHRLLKKRKRHFQTVATKKFMYLKIVFPPLMQQFCVIWLYPYVIGVWWWVCGSFKVTPEVFSCFLQTSQVLPHWLNHHFSLILVLYTETLSC